MTVKDSMVDVKAEVHPTVLELADGEVVLQLACLLRARNVARAEQLNRRRTFCRAVERDGRLWVPQHNIGGS
jgi:hypothetical protein